MKYLFLTTGDPDGVGLEVTLSALKKMGSQSGFQFILIHHQKFEASTKTALKRKFNVSTFPSISQAFSHKTSNGNHLLQVSSSEDPGAWFKQCVHICLESSNVGIATGPMSKDGMRDAGHTELGHTEILKKMCHSEFLFQVYLGSKFNVLLVTDHIPLSQVANEIRNQKKLEKALDTALGLRKNLKFKKPLAVLGLNPHAGESGLIGQEDEFIKHVLQNLDPKRKIFKGPMPADSAFTPENTKKYSLFIAQYHDQGLIPFKSLHGFNEGVHLTTGIPFVRTSVDHGTAKELFGKGLADCGSMYHAIKTAMQLMRAK